MTNDTEYGNVIENIRIDLESRIVNNIHVRYASYILDEKGIPVNNLHQLAIRGKVAVIVNLDGYIETLSFIEDPTYLDLSVLANEQIIWSGDYHHCFFEGFKIIGFCNDIILIQLLMGS